MTLAVITISIGEQTLFSTMSSHRLKVVLLKMTAVKPGAPDGLGRPRLYPRLDRWLGSIHHPLGFRGTGMQSGITISFPGGLKPLRITEIRTKATRFLAALAFLSFSIFKHLLINSCWRALASSIFRFARHLASASVIRFCSAAHFFWHSLQPGMLHRQGSAGPREGVRSLTLPTTEGGVVPAIRREERRGSSSARIASRVTWATELESDAAEFPEAGAALPTSGSRREMRSPAPMAPSALASASPLGRGDCSPERRKPARSTTSVTSMMPSALTSPLSMAPCPSRGIPIVMFPSNRSAERRICEKGR